MRHHGPANFGYRCNSVRSTTEMRFEITPDCSRHATEHGDGLPTKHFAWPNSAAIVAEIGRNWKHPAKKLKTHNSTIMLASTTQERVGSVNSQGARHPPGTIFKPVFAGSYGTSAKRSDGSGAPRRFCPHVSDRGQCTRAVSPKPYAANGAKSSVPMCSADGRRRPSCDRAKQMRRSEQIRRRAVGQLRSRETSDCQSKATK